MHITSICEKISHANYIFDFLFSESVDVTFNFSNEYEANDFKEIVKNAMRNGKKVRLFVDD